MFTKLKHFFSDSRPAAIKDSGASFNWLTGLGSIDDKTNKTFFGINGICENPTELQNIYVASWAAEKFIDTPIDDMFIVPRILKDLDDDVEKEFNALAVTLSLDEKISNAMKAARLYGTALMIIVSMDAPLNMPLNIDNLAEGDLKNILVVDRFRASVLSRCIDIADPNFGRPELYMVNFNYKPGIQVHYSRIIRVDGKRPITDNFWLNYTPDWGISELATALGVIQDEESTLSGVSHMMQEASVPILSAKGLDDSLSGAPDARMSVNRLSATINRLKSIYRTVFIDSNMTMTRLDVNFRQVPEIIDRMWTRLCAVSDIPQTRFMGQSPAGLNSTGDSDMVNYALMVMAMQKHTLTPIYRKLDKLMSKSIGYEKDIDFEFPSLINVSESDQAATKFQNAQADQIYIANGVLSEEEVRQNLSNSDVYDVDITKPIDNSASSQQTVNALAQKIQQNNQKMMQAGAVNGKEEANSTGEAAA